MKKLPIIFIVLLFALPGLAATIYVKDDPNNSGTKVCYKSGGWADAACSDGTGNTTLSASHTASGSNGTLVIAAGIYVGTQLAAGGTFVTGAEGVTVRPASMALDSGSSGWSDSYAGTVTINGNNQSAYVLRISHDNSVVNNLSVSSPTVSYATVYITKTATLNDLIITKGNGSVVSTAFDFACGAACTVNINRPTVSGGVRWIGASGGNNNHTATFNYGKFIGVNTVGYNQGATFNNCIWINSTAPVLYTTGNTGTTVTWNNPIFYGNVGSNQHILSRLHDQTWVVNNGITIGYSDSYGYNGVTLNNSIRNQDPKFILNQYPAVLSFASDDTPNIDWFHDTVAPILESHGMRGTMALFGGLTGEQTTKALALEAAGHEVACHGYAHAVVAEVQGLFTILQAGYTCSKPYSGAGVNTLSCTDGVDTDNYDLTTYTIADLMTQMSSDGYTVGSVTTNYGNVPATVIGYIPSGTSIASAFTLASMQSPYTITKAGETISNDGTTLSTSGGRSYTLSEYTITTLRTALIADSYTVSTVAGGFDGFPATALSTIPAGTSINSALPMVMNGTASRVYNITGCKTYLEGLGLHPVTYVPPIDNTSAGQRQWLYENGWVGSRGEASASASLSAIDAYQIPDWGYSFAKTTTTCVARGETATNCIKENMISKIGQMYRYGYVAVVLAHNESEMNSDQWTAMLDAVAQSGIQVMTLSQLAQYIKTYNPSGDLATADGRTYTRTLIDQSDYHLRSGSPAINAGVDVGLTTDADGKPIAGLPDIGAYERRGKILQ